MRELQLTPESGWSGRYYGVVQREAKETQHLHKSLQLFNDLNNFVDTEVKKILRNDLLFKCSENLNMIG